MSGIIAGPALSVETGIAPVFSMSAFAPEETGVVDVPDVAVVPGVVVAPDVVDVPDDMAVGAGAAEVFEVATGVVARTSGDDCAGVSAGLPAVVMPCALPTWDSFELSATGTAGPTVLFSDDPGTPAAPVDDGGAG